MAKYRCRGPRYSEDELAAIKKELGEIPQRIAELQKSVKETKKKFEAARESGADDATRKKDAQALTLARASLAMATKRQSGLEQVSDRSRKGCGYPLDEVINAVPKDGVQYTVDCPACGNVVSVRSTPVV